MTQTQSDMKRAMLTAIEQQTRMLFACPQRAFWVDAEGRDGSPLKDSELKRLTCNEFALLGELITERKLLPCNVLEHQFFGDTYYQVVVADFLMSLGLESGIKLLRYSDEEQHLLKALSREESLIDPQFTDAKLRVNACAQVTTPKGRIFFEWYRGDFGHAHTAHHSHEKLLEGLIQKGTIKLGGEEKAEWVDGTAIFRKLRL